MIKFNKLTDLVIDLDVNSINIRISRMCNGKTKTVVSDREGKELHNSMENSRIVDFDYKMNEMLNIFCNDTQTKSKGEENELQTEEGVDKKRKK